MIPHIPCLRRGRIYESLDKSEVKDPRDGQVRATISTVNAGIVRKDLQRISESRDALKKLKTRQLIEICAKTGDLFLNGTLPLGTEGSSQTPQQYIETLSATSGLPWVMVRRNMAKIHYALTHMDQIIQGLTRGLPLDILDNGYGTAGGARCCFYAATQALGLVMPSNSPAVNSLWLPAIALKIPVMIKPGREEPWTPYRLIQAFISAGAPIEAFGFYPTDHEGAGELLRNCGRALVFGDQATTQPYQGNPAIQIHGPGFSKIVIGEDKIADWHEYLDLMIASIGDNGGRSCINASTVIVPRYGREIAETLAKKMAAWEPKPASDESACLSAFANPKMADSIDATLEQDLKIPGALDLTAQYRQGPRKVTFEGNTFLRPTIVYCDSWTHKLANREFLFPYASVIEIPQSEMLSQIGPSLVVTAITDDNTWQQSLLECRHIERLNLGPVPTTKISWDQPHEGNLFEFLYRRRSLEMA